MSKPPAKPADASKPRSKLKLAVLAVVPLALGGGGYAGWTYYPAFMQDAEAAEAAAAGHDPIQVSAVPTEIAAETSFTHSYGLAMMIARQCGTVPMKALKAASNEEAQADGLLTNLSWTAAARRTTVLDEKSCHYFLTEIRSADSKAASIVAARLAAEQGKGGH